MAKISDALAERVNKNWSPELRTTITRALMAADAAQDAQMRNATKEQLAAHRGRLALQVGPAVRKAELEMQRHRTQFDADKATLRERSLQHDSPRDAVLARELREVIRGLPDHGARMKLLVGSEADKLVQRSVLEAHPLLSGNLPAESLHAVNSDFLQKHFPNAVASLAERDSSMEVLNASVRLAKETLQRSAELPPHEFPAFYDSIVPAK